MNEEISMEEFEILFRETIKKIYPKEIAEGKIYETESGWFGIKLTGGIK